MSEFRLMIPEELSVYLGLVVTRLQEELDDILVGVYAGGSLALGADVPGRSDVDLAAVVTNHLSQDDKHRIVGLLRHEALPCPARGLELVVYPEKTVRVPTIEPGFDLNLNTGECVPFRVGLEPGVPDAHWFAIDRSILSEHGLTLHGPPARELFAPIPEGMLVPVLADSVRWHETNPSRLGDAVLNDCRSLRYAEEAVWSSKQDAGRWTLRRRGDVEVVAAALAGPSTCAELDAAAVRDFVRLVLERLEGVRPGSSET